MQSHTLPIGWYLAFAAPIDSTISGFVRCSWLQWLEDEIGNDLFLHPKVVAQVAGGEKGGKDQIFFSFPEEYPTWPQGVFVQKLIFGK